MQNKKNSRIYLVVGIFLLLFGFKFKVRLFFDRRLRDPRFFQNFNNTSADFVLISADVLLKMIHNFERTEVRATAI